MITDKKEIADLVKEHTPYIKTIAYAYSNNDDYFTEELIQEGILGLLRACKTFDKKANVTFLTYASWWIKFYISYYIKKAKKADLPTEEIAGLQDITTKGYETPESYYVANEIKRHMIDNLQKKNYNARDVDIILLRYLSEAPLTLQEIGDRYGISRERVNQIETNMINKLRKNLADKKERETDDE